MSCYAQADSAASVLSPSMRHLDMLDAAGRVGKLEVALVARDRTANEAAAILILG